MSYLHNGPVPCSAGLSSTGDIRQTVPARSRRIPVRHPNNITTTSAPFLLFLCAVYSLYLLSTYLHTIKYLTTSQRQTYISLSKEKMPSSFGGVLKKGWHPEKGGSSGGSGSSGGTRSKISGQVVRKRISYPTLKKTNPHPLTCRKAWLAAATTTPKQENAPKTTSPARSTT